MGSVGDFLVDIITAVLVAVVLAIMFKGWLLMMAGLFLLSLLFDPSIYYFIAPRRHAVVAVYSY